MANAAGFIQESIWRDPHWRQLSRTAQALYMQLLSQKELDCAGILPLQANKWAKGCDELTVEQVWTDLGELQQRRFVFYDTDTDEAFVRSYMRNSNVMKSPNMRRAATRAAVLVGSESIRPLLAAELRVVGEAMNDADCTFAANQINPFGTVPEPLPNPSESNPFGTLSEPSGVGEGVGVPTLVSTQVGEEPSQFCENHPNDTDQACFACGQARRTYPERKAKWEADFRAAEALARQAAIDACALCDEFGDITFEDSVRKCNHQEAG